VADIGKFENNWVFFWADGYVLNDVYGSNSYVTSEYSLQCAFPVLQFPVNSSTEWVADTTDSNPVRFIILCTADYVDSLYACTDGLRTRRNSCFSNVAQGGGNKTIAGKVGIKAEILLQNDAWIEVDDTISSLRGKIGDNTIIHHATFDFYTQSQFDDEKDQAKEDFIAGFITIHGLDLLILAICVPLLIFLTRKWWGWKSCMIGWFPCILLLPKIKRWRWHSAAGTPVHRDIVMDVVKEDPEKAKRKNEAVEVMRIYNAMDDKSVKPSFLHMLPPDIVEDVTKYVSPPESDHIV